MPAEVISLLSSSPVRPPPAAIVTSFKATTQTNTRVPCRTLDYDEVRSRNNASSSSLAPTEPVAGTKRISSYQTRPKGHDNDDFLFLSDDFDTTGDLDASFHKKPRTSGGLSHPRKSKDGPAPLQRAKCAAIGSPPRESLQPVRRGRLSNLVEDIEFSSSPIDPASSEATRKAPDVLSDPFASSPKEHRPKSTTRNPIPTVPCYNLPGNSNKNGRLETRNRPAELREDQQADSHKNPQRSSKVTLIDLSSDPGDSPPRHKLQSNPSNARSKAIWDPISSSAPKTHDIQYLLSSPPLTTRARPHPQLRATSGGDSSDSDLPDLDNVDFSKIRTTKRSHSPSSYPTAQTSKQTVKKVSKPIQERERERKQKAEAMEAEKERKRIEKERAKEERALQKEREKALAEVNKLRTDKKVSTPEMIVDIPASISSSLKVQIEALLNDLDVQYETWSSPVEHVVRWRRKVTSRFNKEMGFWEPAPMRIKNENHILVIIQAAEFVKYVLSEEGQDLEAHVLHMKSKFPNTKLIYLIEGLTPWMRKNRNLLNRQFASAVRNLGTSAESGPSSSRPRNRNNQLQEYIDEDKIEDALLSLQVLHETLVHHTNVPIETAQWVATFTQHISTIPYRKARDDSADAGFCMVSGQVRTGDGAKDTYIHMLQVIARLTPSIAYGIVAKYESVTDLVRGLEEEGPLALAQCRKSANKDGALTDHTIGQAISRRVHKIFLGRDPTSTDV
ncbi:ERCC4 domain-containing protein [Xylaria digitata]|nr:ERCC4 domain-containing protein [Xylaria digitata]